MDSGSFHVLECNPPGFQSDEHASGGHRGAFLWAEGSAAYEDEYLMSNRVLRFGFYNVM